MNLDKLISENINKYVNKIIREDNEFNYTGASPLDEFLSHSGEVELSLGGSETELETENYIFFIHYSIHSDAYYENYEESYGETTQQTYGEDEWWFNDFEVSCSDKTDDENEIELSDEDVDKMRDELENNNEIDMDDGEIPSIDDLRWDDMQDRFDMDREDY